MTGEYMHCAMALVLRVVTVVGWPHTSFLKPVYEVRSCAMYKGFYLLFHAPAQFVLPLWWRFSVSLISQVVELLDGGQTITGPKSLSC
jgi:hypothetical protein